MKGIFSLLCIVWLSACSGDDSGARPTPVAALHPVSPLPECADADHSRCDIGDSECQARMMALAACLRQTDPLDGIAIELISQDEYTAILEQDWEGIEEPEINHFAQALSVLNLAPLDGGSRADGIAAYVEFAWGAFRASEKRIVMVDHGEPLDSAAVDAVLVHELVHALQDADYDLQNWPEAEPLTLDSHLAAQSVIEGEAKFYQYRVGVPLLGLDISEVDFDAVMQEQLSGTLAQVYESPGYGISYTTFAYALGAIQAWTAWQKDGPRGIDKLFASPPTTTWQIMAPLFGPELTEPEIVEIAEPTTTLTLDSQDTFGAWGLNLFLLSNGVGPQNSTPLALAWQGDHLWVYTDETNQHTYALWQIQLASAEDAAKVDAACPDLFAGLEHGTSGSRVFVSSGVGAGVRAPMAQLTEWGETWIAEQ